MIGTITFIIIVAIVLIIGAYGYKISKKTVQDYAIAGGTLGYVVMAANAAATLVSTGTMMGFMGAMYAMGLPYFVYVMMPIWHMAILMIFMGTRFIAAREVYGHYSPLMTLHQRYGSRLFTLVLSILWFFTCALYAAMQLKGVGTLIEAIVGIPLTWATVVAAIIAIAYILMGGYRAVAWTNVIWVTLYFLGFWLPAILLFLKYSVFDLAQQVDPKAFTLSGFVNYDARLLLWTNLVNMWSGLGFVWAFYSIMGSRTLKIAKVSSMFGWLNYVILITPSFAIATIYGRALLSPEQLPSVDLVFFKLIELYVSEGFVLPYAIGITAAGISTAASLCLLQGVIIESGVVGIALGIKLDQRSRILVARVGTVLGAIVGLAIALALPLPVGLLFSYAMAFMGFTVPAMLGGLFWKKSNTISATLSMLAGVIVYIVGMFVKYPVPGNPARFIIPPELLYGFTVCALVYLIVTPLTKNRPSEDVGMIDKLAAWIRENA
uniref:Sodium:solute symporter family protein n=1 Tax=Ignisphaera aggregans TaxID=334771 RepID=A0A7C2ZMD0_9CREN